MKNIILLIFIFTLISLISFGVTHAFFSNAAQSTNNIFAASSQFPVTPTPSPSSTPTPTPPIAHTLVMNEILPVSSCNSGQTNGQFLELWNGSGATVNLKDFKLSDGTNTVAIANSNTDLPNGAFAVLVKAEGVINQCLGDVHGAVTVNLGGNVDLNTGLLKLLNSVSSVIDRVEFGASNSGVLQTLPNQSIERIQIGFDSALSDTFHASDFLVQCTPTPGTWVAPTGHCNPVISEVQIATSSAINSDFIEFYNPTSSPINLNNFTLVKRTSSGVTDTPIKSFTISNIIPAHGFYLWASTSGNYATQIHADVSTGDTLAGNNSVALRYGVVNTGILVDSVGWGTLTGAPLIEGSVFSTSPPDGKGLERKAYTTSTQVTMEGGVDSSHGNGFDSNNNATDFILRNVSQPQNSASAAELP